MSRRETLKNREKTACIHFRQTPFSPSCFAQGLLAQLVERLNGIEEVSSSNLLGSTTFKGSEVITSGPLLRLETTVAESHVPALREAFQHRETRRLAVPGRFNPAPGTRVFSNKIHRAAAAVARPIQVARRHPHNHMIPGNIP